MPRRDAAAGDGRMPSRLAPSDLLVLVAVQLVAGAIAIAVLRLLTFHPNVLVALAVGLPLAVLLVAWPQWAVPAFVALTWTLVGERFLGDVPSPINVGAAVLLAYSVLQALSRPSRAREPLVVATLVALPVAVAGLLSNEGSDPVPDELADVAFILIGALALSRAGDVPRALAALAAVSVPLGLGALYSVVVGSTAIFPVAGSGAARAAGPVGDPELFALTLAALAPVAANLVYGSGWARPLGFAALASLTGGIIATGTFGALALAAAGVAVLSFVRGSAANRTALPALALALAILPLAGAQAGSKERVADPPAGGGGVALEMFADRPISGVGPGQYPVLHGEYADDPQTRARAVEEPRSLPLQIAAEQGLIGLAGWCGAAFVLARLVLVRRAWRAEGGAALLAALGTYLAGSLFLNGDDLRPLYLLVGMTLALAVSAPGPRPGLRGR